MQLADAYAAAETITHEQARNFYYGIRLLPRSRRAALCAMYALARRVDDIGDGNLSVADKLAGLAEVRSAVDRVAAGGSGGDDPVMIAVADAARTFPVPLAAFGELIDGVEMDVRGRHYETFEDLVEYCRCVAGAIGRLCLGVFAHRPHPDATTWADALGIALQQTNILRDIREDLGNGRIYLPRADLDRFGVDLVLDANGNLTDPDGHLRELIAFSSARAQTWYDDGLRLLPSLDRRSAACAGAMAGIYRHLQGRIQADPGLVFDRRLSLSGREKALVAVRALSGRTA